MPIAPEPIEETLIARVLQRRPRDAHKGDFGHVLIVGGGRGMPGAARLCGEACLRSGAGLVTVAANPGTNSVTTLVAGRPELMCHETQTESALQSLMERADVMVIGPGLGYGGWGHKMFEFAIGSDLPMVLDADALRMLSVREALAPPRSVEEKQARRWVLTPHPGEAAGLLGLETAQAVQKDRVAAVQALAERYGGIVVLKGAGTLVGAPGRTPALCERGNPGMATAGMGDVLSGVVAALLAQVPDPWDAVRAAVMAHAMAGDLAAREGERGLIASDVIAQLR